MRWPSRTAGCAWWRRCGPTSTTGHWGCSRSGHSSRRRRSRSRRCCRPRSRRPWSSRRGVPAVRSSAPWPPSWSARSPTEPAALPALQFVLYELAERSRRRDAVARRVSRAGRDRRGHRDPRRRALPLSRRPRPAAGALTLRAPGRGGRRGRADPPTRQPGGVDRFGGDRGSVGCRPAAHARRAPADPGADRRGCPRGAGPGVADGCGSGSRTTAAS